MPRFEFQYPGEGDELLMWIQAKIDKIYWLNRGKKGGKFENLQDLEVRENDMFPTEFNAYSRSPEASVYFALDPVTGAISVSYYSESFGNKGGNPWWCIAESRPESSVCGTGPTKITMLPADDEHAMSIKEYLETHIKREVPTGNAMGAANVIRANEMPAANAIPAANVIRAANVIPAVNAAMPASPNVVGPASGCGPRGCWPWSGGSRKNRKASRKHRKASRKNRKGRKNGNSRKH